MLDWQVTRTVETPASRASRHPPGWLLAARRAGDTEPAASLRLRFDIGAESPRHWFHLGTLVHCAPEIGVTRRQRTLTLCSDLCGGVEMLACQGSGEAVAVLVRAALLWLARDVPEARSLFAERPGVAGPAPSSRSAFFDAVLSHFVREEVAFGPGDEPRWLAISGMLPRHPLYVGMLAPELQAQIGQPGIESDWDRAFAQEGLATGRLVTVLDAAPVCEADLARMATARAAARRGVEWVDAALVGASPVAARPVLVLDERQDRVALVNGWCDAGALRLPRGDAPPALAEGTRVWCA